jgi:ABC-type Zn uptake system ZnuABC Zn-binding protein ZnuA
VLNLVLNRGWTLVAAGCMSLAGCRGEPATGDRSGESRPVVAVTLFPLGDVARVIAGSAADVVVMLPAGATPATYEPTPELVRRLARARLVVAVGAGADGWGADLARAWRAELLLLSDAMTLGYDGNPHVWLDPILVRDAVLPQLKSALIRVAPASEDSIRIRAAAYHDRLTDLDREIRDTLASLTSRAFVATHPAWPYFAERYHLRQVGVLYPAPGRELGPRELATLVDEARRAGVRGVFTEPQLGQTGVRALAEELQAQIGMLDPLGGPGEADRDSYEALLRYNAREFSRLLGGPRE